MYAKTVKVKRIHYILTGLSLSILLLSINRLTPLTSSYLQPYDFLRWLDFNAMLPIPLFSILLYYLLKREVIGDSLFQKTGKYVILMLILITGIYLFAAGSGDHEVTNYLNSRFCDAGKVQTPICNIIAYNDDEFSHYVYYIGFILLNVALMFFEYFVPRKKTVSRRDLNFVGANALFIALGIFANLAFEEIGLDLYFFGAVMLLSMYLLYLRKWKFATQPVLFYFFISYSVGVLGTILYKVFL